MKKLLALSLILVMILCSCNTGNKNEDAKEPLTYTIYTSGSDDALVDNLSDDVGVKFENISSVSLERFSGYNLYVYKNRPQERKFKIGDAEYTMEYKASSDSIFSGKKNADMIDFGAYDLYRAKNGTDSIDIEVRPQTDIITKFFDFGTDLTVEGDFTEDQALEMAESLFKEIYGENVFKEYRLTNLFTANGQFDKSINVFFKRIIYGYSTTDTVGFTINQKGELSCILAKKILLFNDAENEVSKTEIEAAEKVLRESISDEWKLSEWAKLTRDSKGKIYLFVNGINEKISDESGDQLFYINVN